jgi:L-amino acid N-acyltransferase YncA
VDLHIRDATVADLPAIVDIYNQCLYREAATKPSRRDVVSLPAYITRSANPSSQTLAILTPL